VTPNRPENKDALELAERLGDSIARINQLFAFRKIVKRLIWGLAISVSIDILLSVAIFFFFHNSQITACHIGNDARADQITLWHGLVQHFSDPHPTQQDAIREKAFLAFVDHTFRPVDCAQIYKVPVR
jgi:hypothetical protein